MEKRIVYGASSGAYSDYSVTALFEREEDADQYVADGHADRTEEFEFYPAGYRAKVTHYYTVSRHSNRYPRDGEEIKARKTHRIDDDGSFARSIQRPKVHESDYNGGWSVYADCLDADKAIKAVVDRVTVREARAAGVW